MILLQTKRKRYEVWKRTFKKKTLNCHNHWQISAFLLNGDTKITDWITSKKPICRRHPINLNNNIKDILQKKDLQKRYRYKYLSLIFVIQTMIQTMKVEVAHSNMQHCSTLDAPKNFWMTSKTVFYRPQHDNRQNSHSTSQSCLLKGKKSKCFRVKLMKQTIIPSKISSAYEWKTIALLPRFEFAQIIEHEQTNNTFIKSHSTERDFFMHLV